MSLFALGMVIWRPSAWSVDWLESSVRWAASWSLRYQHRFWKRTSTERKKKVDRIKKIKTKPVTQNTPAVILLRNDNLARKELRSENGKTLKLWNYVKHQMHINNALIRDERSGFLLRYFHLICQLRWFTCSWLEGESPNRTEPWTLNRTLYSQDNNVQSNLLPCPCTASSQAFSVNAFWWKQLAQKSHSDHVTRKASAACKMRTRN